MPKLGDIRKIVSAKYRFDVGWGYLEKWLEDAEKDSGLELCPDFQRGHVWSDEQRSRYVEWCLKGGLSARNIYWNCPGWPCGGPIQLVDGLQRLTAIRRFMDSAVPVFGLFLGEWDDGDQMKRCMMQTMSFYIADLTSRATILQWYLDINAGGVVHSREEISRVRELLEEEKKNVE